jgi:hypothetical protein
LLSDNTVIPRRVTDAAVQDVRQSLIELSDAVQEEAITPEIREFYKATKESQNKFPQRRQMHDTLVPLIQPAFA